MKSWGKNNKVSWCQIENLLLHWSGHNEQKIRETNERSCLGKSFFFLDLGIYYMNNVKLKLEQMIKL